MPIVNDDGVAENELEAAVNALPNPLRRVYVMAKDDSTQTASSENNAPAASVEPSRPIPYGLNPPEGGQKAMSAMGQLLKDAAVGLVTLPQRAIENSQFSVESGVYDPSVPVEAALNTLTFGLPAAKVGAVGSAGGKLGPVKDPMKDAQTAADHYWELLTTKGDYSAAAFEAQYAAKQNQGWGTDVFEDFQAKVAKKFKDKPFEQIPFEEAPSSFARKTVSDKKSSYDYEEMGNGKYEVFDPKTGKTEATVNSEKEAKDLVGLLGGKSETQKAMDEIESILNFWDDKAAEFGKNAAKASPVDLVKQGKHNTPEYWQSIYDSLDDKPKSAKESFLAGVQQARAEFKSSVAEIQNKLKNLFRGPVGDQIRPPIISGKGDYTEPAYRGLTVYGGETPQPIYKYDKSGEHYSTANPMLADMYAGYLSSHPGIKVPEGVFEEGAQVMPLLINTKNYHYFDAKGEIWQKANKKAIEEAKRQGKKGVIVDNVWDEPNSTTALGKPNKIYITFPEGAGTVKSRFAEKFDESSPNYLHTIGMVGPAGLVAYEVMKEENK